MGAKTELKRSLKSRQLKALKLAASFDGADAAPFSTIGGPDSKFVSAVTDLGVGQYTLIFSQSFEQNIWPDSILCEGDAKAEVVAVGKDRITFDVRDSAGALADAICYVNVMAYDHRFFY